MLFCRAPRERAACLLALAALTGVFVRQLSSFSGSKGSAPDAQAAAAFPWTLSERHADGGGSRTAAAAAVAAGQPRSMLVAGTGGTSHADHAGRILTAKYRARKPHSGSTATPTATATATGTASSSGSAGSASGVDSAGGSSTVGGMWRKPARKVDLARFPPLDWWDGSLEGRHPGCADIVCAAGLEANCSRTDPTCCTYWVSQIFDFTAWLFTARGWRWAVTYGTLLGALRQQSIMPGDKDFDVAVVEEAHALLSARDEEGARLRRKIWRYGFLVIPAGPDTYHPIYNTSARICHHVGHPDLHAGEGVPQLPSLPTGYWPRAFADIFALRPHPEGGPAAYLHEDGVRGQYQVVNITFTKRYMFNGHAVPGIDEGVEFLKAHYGDRVMEQRPEEISWRNGRHITVHVRYGRKPRYSYLANTFYLLSLLLFLFCLLFPQAVEHAVMSATVQAAWQGVQARLNRGHAPAAFQASPTGHGHAPRWPR